jgi:hypothetical protein
MAIIISTGTLRPQDLIPAFLATLQGLGPAASADAESFSRDLPPHARDEEVADWWGSEDCAWLLDDIVDALDGHAPDGHHFSASEGDGACFGFWESDPY